MRYIRIVFRAFPLPQGKIVTGKFEGMEAELAGADAGLVDTDEINTLSHLVKQESHGVGLRGIEGQSNGKLPVSRSPGGEIVE